MPDFKILPWDTAFFGFPVARIEAGVRSAAGVADALDALRRRAVRLCYWMPEYGEENAGIARKLNGENVSAHACYALHNLSVAAAMPIAGVRIEQHEGERISPEILSLARSAGRFSRFAADRRMPAGTPC